MFEKIHESVVPKHKFYLRVLKATVIGAMMIVVALLIGMCGYHYYENLPWVDAFANAAMILSGMGQLAQLQTTGGKIFAGLYALFSGLVFIVVIGIIFAPTVHRFFHKMHVDER